MAGSPFKRHVKQKPNDFVRSVMKLSPGDIPQKKSDRPSPLSLITDNLRTVIFLVCFGVLIFSGFYLYDTVKQYDEAEDLYENLGSIIAGDVNYVEQMYASPPSVPTPDYQASQNLTDEDIEDIVTPVRPVINKEFERIHSQLVSLKKQYPDLYGWIILEGTVINYPIMQAEDNDYYLDHSYKGTKLKAGAIFADYRNRPTLMDNRNLVLYGHHMSNNTMFNALDKFLAKSFFETNNIVKIYTLDGMFTYKVFTVFETNMYYNYIKTGFGSNEEVEKFVKEMAGNSIHPSPAVPLNGESRILTLSTCTNRSDGGRLAVQAVMIDSYLATSP
jgi:sortase B